MKQKKLLFLIIAFSVMAITSCTQKTDGNTPDETTPATKVYDEEINPMQQIDEALTLAKENGKYVICQVGGNWCPWCLRFAQFIKDDNEISKTVDDNFVYIHVNYNPRKSQSEEKATLAKEMMARLGNPARFGFPVFVVLNDEGEVIHTQDSSFLEEGEGYNKEKVLRFFNCWTPEAISKSKE